MISASGLRPARHLAPLLLALGLGAGAAAEPVNITILHINDWDRLEEADGRGGLARLVAILEEERGAREHVLLVHAGDAISPSLLSGFDQGAHMIEVLNRLDLAAFALGNHEFDFGPEALLARIAEADFPVVTSNVVDGEGEPLAGSHETRMVEIAGITLGILGLTTPEAASLSNPGDIRFLPLIETVERLATELRVAGADLVVAVAHIDVDEDLALVRQGAVDLLLSGHDHHLMTYYDGRVAMVEAGEQADYVVAVDLTVAPGEPTVWEPRFRILDSADYAPDAEALALVESYGERLAAELDVAIGEALVELDSRGDPLRSEETTLGNLVADAVRAALEADVAIINGGGIRGERIIPPGSVLTRRDIHAALPFSNRTAKLLVTGADLLAALENGLSLVERGAGRFPQVSGISFVWDPGKPAGARVVEVRAGDRPLDLAASYTLATNDFMANGGDGYDMLAKAERLVDPRAGRLLASQVIEHIGAEGGARAAIEGRIRPVD